MTLRRGKHWSMVVTCGAVAFGCSSVDSGTAFSELPPMNASGVGSTGSSGGASPQQGGMPQGGGGTLALAGVDAGGSGAPPVAGAATSGGAPTAAGGSAGASSGTSGSNGMVGAAGDSAEGGSDSGGPGSGGSGAAGGGAGSPATFAEVKTILDRSCSGSLGCHGQLGRRPSLRSSDTNLYETLETVVVSKCGGDTLVVPGRPSESALIEVVSGGCGSLRMPPSCSSAMCLPSADLTTLTRWIEAGAPRN